MPHKLPINLQDLLRQRTVEGERIEYKAGWNPDAIIRTLCAFANDFENLGGGYVVIGQDCDAHGHPIFPPVGLAANQLDKIQQELLAACQLIQPPYFPALSTEVVEGRNLLVLWAPGGMNRPYKAPASATAKAKTWHYYIRRYSSTVEAKGETEQELLSLTVQVPWDDRFAQHAQVSDLSKPLMLEYLTEVGSALANDASQMTVEELGRQMHVVDGPHEAPRPKNVETVIKHADRAEATRLWNFPYVAIEEALVNAVYHRSYEVREPIEVRIDRKEVVVLSFPGPDRSIRLADFETGRAVSRRYRNRRIGEFLKELDLTEGRSTGMPKILKALAANGSPAPLFETDEDRLAYVVRLPVRPLAEQPGGSTDQVTMEVTMEVARLLNAMKGDMARASVQDIMGLKNADHFRKAYLLPALSAGMVEMTLPDKPNSKSQRYRLTPKGQQWHASQRGAKP